MSKIIVQGGRRLSGKVKISGAKNAVLPIIAASILGQEGETVIHDVPPLEDVRHMKKVMESLGIMLSFSGDTLSVRTDSLSGIEPSGEYVRKIRASFLVSGPLLARCGRVRIAFPGGCEIGTRAIDQHLKGFEALGAKIELGKGYIEAETKGRLQGAKIYLDVPSVGATENIMMAASLADGVTVIENAAREPEIVDLANYINAMGGKIRGAGTGTIRIEGVRSLKGARHTVIPDRIEAGTYMIAAAITDGDLLIEGAIADHLRSIISKLQEMGVIITEDQAGLRVKGEGKLRAVDLKTLPHPGFPTDLQSQMMALLLKADGTSVVTETVFENRFRHVEEFKKMNARIVLDGMTAIINGNTVLKGAKVRATDLRAGAALVLAGLAADGETEIGEVHHIDRGYSDMVKKLAAVGADICRTDSMERLKEEQPAEQGIFSVQPSLA